MLGWDVRPEGPRDEAPRGVSGTERQRLRERLDGSLSLARAMAGPADPRGLADACRDVIELADALGDPAAKANAVQMLGQAYLRLGELDGAREAYEQTALRHKLGRYHDDVDSAFWGWNRIWLDTAFRTWNIEPEVAQIRAPVLAIQGCDDEYGTLAQIWGIAQRVPGTRLLELPDCAHSPHRDQPDAVVAAAVAFIQAHHSPA